MRRPDALPTLLGASALLVLLGSGCAAKRQLTVLSDPPGARIRLDDREVGQTPQTIDFGHYGIRRVTLYLDGHRTHSERIELRAPWYARFPIDLVSEVLLPFGWRDRRTMTVVLEEGEEHMSRPGLRSVLQRADVLRRAGPEGPRDLPETTARELPPAKEPSEAADSPEGPRSEP